MRREIYDYFGVSEEIVQNRAGAEKMDAFYRGQLAPFYMQLAQGLTNAIFTERERGFGNEILCKLGRIQFEPLDKPNDERGTESGEHAAGQTGSALRGPAGRVRGGR